MGAIVVFDYDVWITRYPEFSNVEETLADAYFNEACLYQVNDGSGPVGDPTQQLTLLNMLTAHIAQLYSGSTAQAATGAVGRVGNASQGSVSVGLVVGGPEPGSKDWFVQTKYGYSWWQATMGQRMAVYKPGPRRIMSPWLRW